AALARQLARADERRFVVVEARELRLRKCLGQQNGRCAMTASDICDVRAAFELFPDAFQCRDPFRHQMRRVARAEKSLGAAEQAGIVLMPSNTSAGTERHLELW